MRRVKKLKFNKKFNEKIDNEIIGKFSKLLFITLAICLLVSLISGCINHAQKQTEEFVTPGEASITIIQHDMSENNSSSSDNVGENTPGENKGTASESFVENRIDNIPYYFIAVHNVQTDKADLENKTEENYVYLIEVVQKADEYDIKLTLMFCEQWATFIKNDPGRLAAVNEWKENGHEIEYNSCVGFKNCEECEVSSDNTSAENGINEFILTNTVNGIERKVLSHSEITTKNSLNQAIKTFEKLDSSVAYGVLMHTTKEQIPFFYAYLDHLHSIDPEGLNSNTIASIIEKKLLVEK